LKATRYDGQELRRVLAGMATDRTVCARIASQWKRGGLFDTSWANLAGGWCVGFYQKYGDAPNGQLQVIFEDWVKKGQQDIETVKGVEHFLSFVSDEWSQSKPPNSEQLLDMAKHCFDRVKVRELIDAANEDLELDNPKDALTRFSSASETELGMGSVLQPVSDFLFFQHAWDADNARPLVHFPGPLGNFLGDTFSRESLVAFMGPDKTGKSFWLQECAIRALKGRNRVAYFELGDLQQDEVALRLGRRATMRPRWPGTVSYPVGIRFDEEKKVRVKHEKRVFEEELTASMAYKALRRVCRGRDDMLQLFCRASRTISAEGVHSVLTEFGRNGWFADVVILDYADILAPPSGVRETLDQIDETWSRLHRIGQESHCLVVTATQSNAAAYGEKQATLGRKHFSGRKTKLAHVNAMLGINYTEADKDLGIMRLNWVVRRNAAFKETTTVTVAGCLDVCCPVILSIM